MRLRTMLDGAGPITLSSNMLDATLNRFKHSSNISSTFFHVGWYCMRFRAHSPCWINILERKMSISIKFESSNARMPIRFSFVRWVVSFVLQYGLTKWRKSRAKKRNYQKWQKEMDRWWIQDLTELLQKKTCLWDIFSNKYLKREVKERAYKEWAEHFDYWKSYCKN